MEQGHVNDLDYEENDETIMNKKMFEEEVNEKDEGNRIIKKVDGRVRLLKKLDGRVRLLKMLDRRVRIEQKYGRGVRSLAAKLNGRTTLFKKPTQMFWVV